jgi:hypothetical protein
MRHWMFGITIHLWCFAIWDHDKLYFFYSYHIKNLKFKIHLIQF